MQATIISNAAGLFGDLLSHLRPLAGVARQLMGAGISAVRWLLSAVMLPVKLWEALRALNKWQAVILIATLTAALYGLRRYEVAQRAHQGILAITESVDERLEAINVPRFLNGAYRNAFGLRTWWNTKIVGRRMQKVLLILDGDTGDLEVMQQEDEDDVLRAEHEEELADWHAQAPEEDEEDERGPRPRLQLPIRRRRAGFARMVFASRAQFPCAFRTPATVIAVSQWCVGEMKRTGWRVNDIEKWLDRIVAATFVRTNQNKELEASVDSYLLRDYTRREQVR
jgi:hypothetical protein